METLLTNQGPCIINGEAKLSYLRSKKSAR